MAIRPARVADAQAICELINYYAERGRMLHRSLENVYETMRDSIVAVDAEHRVVGCAAVHVFWDDLAEVKSLAVARDVTGEGIGTKLLRAAIEEAMRLGVAKLFALTYEKDFFLRLGFEVIDRRTLPEKVWRECISCPKAEACDEIAVMLQL